MAAVAFLIVVTSSAERLLLLLNGNSVSARLSPTQRFERVRDQSLITARIAKFDPKVCSRRTTKI